MGNDNGAGRRRGGIIGIAVVAAYIVLRFGLLAWREHEEGMSTGGIVISLVLIALAVFVVIEIVFAVSHARTRSRERALATQHPGAHLAAVTMKRDLAKEIENAASMLGTTLVGRPPRRGYATLVADHNGIGVYTGGSTPTLVLGIPRQFVQSVGSGETTAGGRYQFGRVDALRVVVSNGQWTAIDLPVYRTVIGFPKTLRGAELDARVREVAAAAGVQVQTAPY
ncbi:hypothetical protein [Curtobacterium sp. Leaf261]|uniref:hypothetical protein n=1 Tax=Curtobacterium sp. Leaf261 TaxID=1736311 RepID=UPI0006F72E5B|nr:hypothetical protein [Curtobacterium sp. Leaf261]KQO65131.1 hypothetical protein ASF23_03145 [Curtobacterium sp. Leaf261]